MASPYRKTKKIRKRKARRNGQERRRQLRNNGSTPSLDKILGPLSS